ncbi:MerR family transcriptional regulator [Sneathiella aquimaris]|uniref:MerR family transcriptional regulator n=1 Tax=Sneathiella aquimaris TaxID=2599305 RepID=UPI00146BBDCA|nr:MerR family transcriptional regulator [Sneathiella aquimaris]
MYSIGTMVHKFDLSRTTLLFYEKKGLLVPKRQKGNRYRLYSNQDCETLACIKLLRKSGLTIEQIKERLQGHPMPSRETILRDQISILSDKIDVLTQQKILLQTMLAPGNALRTLPQKDWIFLLAVLGQSEQVPLKQLGTITTKMQSAYKKILDVNLRQTDASKDAPEYPDLNI